MRIVTAFLSQFGGVGDDLFFGISAWFLCVEHSPSLKRNCRRAWILERQLLFYSLLPLVLVLSAQYGPHVQVFESTRAVYGAVIHSVFPTISSLWWYPTAYIIFLLIHPMLDQGLRSLGEHGHGMLALVLLAVWGVLPGQSYGMGLSVVLFVFIYVLVSYVRWYRDRWVRSSRIGRNAVNDRIGDRRSSYVDRRYCESVILLPQRPGETALAAHQLRYTARSRARS